MAFAYLAHVAAGSTDGDTFTTSAIDTSGADFLVAYVAEKESAGDTLFSDSKGNTWQTDIAEQKDIASLSILGRIFYCKNPTSVGSGHTFTVSSNGGGGLPLASVVVAAFSGAHLTAPLDQQNGTVDVDAGTSNTTGSITPSENDELVITGLGWGGGGSATISINGGFTITDQVDRDATNHRGVALAYLIQTTAAAANPTWTYSTNQYAVASIASFKKAAGGGGGPVATRDLTTLLSGQ